MTNGNADVIAHLNRRRRELKKAIRSEREKQRSLVAPTVQHVQKLLEDHADLYFSADGEHSMKNFEDRLQLSTKEMVSAHNIYSANSVIYM
jgi:glutamate synthase domain-containing protein 3